MATTTNAVLADTITTVLQEARDTEQFSAIMSGLAWRIKKKLHEGKNVNVPYWGVVAAHKLTEGVDMIASETMSDTLVTVTPQEVGCKLLLTDKMVRDNSQDVNAAAGRLLGAAMELIRDQDGILLFQSASTTLGGGSTATMGQYAAARALIKGNPVSSGGPGPGNLCAVYHPYVGLDLVDVLTPIVPTAGTTNVGGGSMMDEVLARYTIGKLFGMNMIEDGNITAAAGTCHGGVFAMGKGGALILATANEWEVKTDEDPSLRATELNVVGEYGWGLYMSQWVVDMNHDAGTPA